MGQLLRFTYIEEVRKPQKTADRISWVRVPVEAALRLFPRGGPAGPKPRFSPAEALVSLALMMNQAFRERPVASFEDLRPAYRRAAGLWGWQRATVRRFILEHGPRILSTLVEPSGLTPPTDPPSDPPNSLKGNEFETPTDPPTDPPHRPLVLDSNTRKRSNVLFVQQIVADLNEATGKRFRPGSKATAQLIEARLREGFTVEDFRRVHRTKAAQWRGDPKMQGYLRPETLYCPKHFESYLNEPASAPGADQDGETWGRIQ